MDSQFFVTLPSNSLSEPKNSASQFTVRLPQRLTLCGEWECSLVEIIYPHTWENLTYDDAYCLIHHASSGNSVLVRLPSGFYHTCTSVTEAIQWVLRVNLLNHATRIYIPE
jgi:hypothetical protein